MHHGIVLLQVFRGFVEPGKGVAEAQRVHARNHPVELAEHGAHFEGMLRALGRVERLRGGNERERPPKIAVAVPEEILPAAARDNARDLPDAVCGAALDLQLLVVVVRENAQVFHNPVRLGENMGIHTLDNDPLLGKMGAENGEIGVVHVSASRWAHTRQPPRHIELFCYFNRFHKSPFPSMETIAYIYFFEAADTKE